MQECAGGRTKIRSVTYGDVIDGVDGLGSRTSLPMSSGSASGRTDEREMIRLVCRIVSWMVFGGCSRGYYPMISPMHAEIYS